ncbi:MAG: hypothetical protein QXD03_03255 [Candidatus Anstonellales archaeon]
MRLSLLDIDDFIKRNKLMEVRSDKLYRDVKNKIVDEDGLWSFSIFGSKGSQDRMNRFGYIELNCTIVHPEAYQIVSSLSTDIKKLLKGSNKYIVDSEGNLLQENNSGGSGPEYFKKIIGKLDLRKISKKGRDEYIKFIEDNMDRLFIKRILVIPAGIRDFIQTEKHTRIMYSEINDLYSYLIKLSGTVKSIEDDELRSKMSIEIQEQCIKINRWIKDIMKGKFGIFRGLLLRKVNDFSGRCVITIDPNIPLGYIGVPWHVLFLLYEPFCLNRINKDPILKNEICRITKMKNFTIDTFKIFSSIINNSPESIDYKVKNMIIEILKDIVNDKQILYKRDAVVTRGNWRSAHIVITDTMSAVLNPLDLGPLRGDIDGDTIALYSVFTKKANEEAKKLNPIYNKQNYFSCSSTDDLTFNITLDAISTIYEATK